MVQLSEASKVIAYINHIHRTMPTSSPSLKVIVAQSILKAMGKKKSNINILDIGIGLQQDLQGYMWMEKQNKIMHELRYEIDHLDQIINMLIMENKAYEKPAFRAFLINGSNAIDEVFYFLQLWSQLVKIYYEHISVIQWSNNAMTQMYIRSFTLLQMIKVEMKYIGHLFITYQRRAL